MSRTLHYTPGDGSLLVRNGLVCLLAGRITPPDLDRLWRALDVDASASGDGFDEVLDTLVAIFGLRTLPDFVLMRSDDTQGVVLVRGGVEVAARAAAGTPRPLASDPGMPWTRHVAGSAGVLVGTTADDMLPLVAGVVRASGVDVRDGRDTSVPQVDEVEEAGEVEGAGEVEPEPAELEPAEPEPAEPEPAEPEPDEPEPGEPAVVAVEPDTVEVVEPAPAEPGAPQDDTAGYTALFRRRRGPAVPEHSALPADLEQPAPDLPDLPDHPAAPTTPPTHHTQVWRDQDDTDDAPPTPLPPTPPPPAAPPDAPPSSGRIIHGIPGFAAPSQPPGPPPSVPPAPQPAPVARPLPPVFVPPPPPTPPPVVSTPAGPDHATQDEEQSATIPRPAGQVARRTAPDVLAVRCGDGHWSPAHAATCRVCEAELPVQQPVWIARPTLGRLRLPGGDVLDVDKGFVFGRSPEAPADSPERPHLVNISSYGPHLSRQHLEIVLDGWHVMARDLGSTEGTTVTLPGHLPERLRTHELVSLTAGTTVDLAGDYVFTFEVLR